MSIFFKHNKKMTKNRNANSLKNMTRVKHILQSARHFASGYYNLLLVCLFLLFIFRPYDRGPLYTSTWKFLLTVMLLSAIFNCNHGKKIKWTATLLAIPTITFSWLNMFHYQDLAVIGNCVFTIAFLLICTSSIIYDVVLKATVTFETLRGVICAYFMVAFVFASLYFLIEYLIPGSFKHIQREVPYTGLSNYMSEMLYFSFITLLTIGYGDITPLKDVGQTAVVIEGMIGQFYVAILVARLVAVYSLYSNKGRLSKVRKR